MNLNECVQLLERSLVYHATLGGKELSHSNIVSALAQKYPSAFARFIAPFFGVSPEQVDIIEPKRESRNLDIDFTLRIGNQNGGLTVENKLKAIPKASQLIKYSDETNKKKSNWKHVLLSLSKPAFFKDGIFITPGGKTWKYVNYMDLGNSVEEMVNDIELISHEDALFAREYALVCKTLHEIQEQFEFDWNNGRYDFYDNDVHDLLLQIRLQDLYAKIQCGKIALKLEEAISNVLSNDVKLVSPEGSIPDPNTAFVNSGYTNQQGLAEVKMGLPVSGFKACVGVQIQGGDIRLLFECDSSKSEAMAKKLRESNLWFTFTKGKAEDKKGEFYRFTKKFLYVKKKIGHPLLTDLVSEVTDLVMIMQERRVEIGKTVSSV